MMKQEIPEELITDILWRLPISQCIARFQCVCKSWRTLLSGPSFILRDDKSADSCHQIMTNFLNKNQKSSDYSLYSADTLEPLLPSPVPLPSKPEIQGPLDHSGLQVAGCCNGLICISHYYENDLILWNPATSETKVIPPSHSQYWYTRAVGFGFDSETDDYKIVRPFKQYYDDDDPSKGRFVVEVYSLRNDSWMELDDDHNNGYSIPHLPYGEIPQYIKGKLYWCQLRRQQNLRFVSFEISRQEFQELELPCPSDRPVVGEEPECLLREESMIALFPLYNDDEFACEIWVLLKYWVSESWEKLFVIAKPSISEMTIRESIGILRGSSKCLFLATRKSSKRERDGTVTDHADDHEFIVAFDPETGKFNDVLRVDEGNGLALMINYIPSQVCMRDYYISSS